MTIKSITKETKAEFLADLRATLNPGETLHCIIRNVAPAGMSRSIDIYRFHCVNGKVEKEWLSWRVAAVLGKPWDHKRECIRVAGCGMDMIFATVYSLGRVLWPEGFGVKGEKVDDKAMYAPYRPNSKEHAAQMVANGWSFRGRNGDTSGWDNDGGYALRSEQL